MPYFINLYECTLGKVTRKSIFRITKISLHLRIPDSYDAKIAKIGNFWKFWPVIQLINHLFKIRQKAFLTNAP